MYGWFLVKAESCVTTALSRRYVIQVIHTVLGEIVPLPLQTHTHLVPENVII